MKLSANDERLLHRFLDGELPELEAAACRARLVAEPTLREGLQGLQQLHRVFTVSAAPGVAAPAGFTAGVLAAARRLPSREQMRQVDAEQAAVEQGLRVLCRRLLIAAAVLFSLGLAWQAGLLGDRRADTLQAAPALVQDEMERLDALIQSGAIRSGGIRAEGAPVSGPRGERHGK
jgi:anti-sigma factor RsiW